jgi:phosphatidylglycerol:prolipoprotein diacylglycerol transferase
VLQDNIQRYPTQLMEAFFALLLAAVGVKAFLRYHQRVRAGMIGLCLMTGYALFRFAIEYYRGDERGFILVRALSTSQFISLGVGVIGGILIFWLQRQDRIAQKKS